MTDEEKVEEEEQNDEEVMLLEEKDHFLLEHFSKEEMQEKLNELQKSVKEKDEKIKNLGEWKNKYMLLQAEFENAQKRWVKQRAVLRTQYTASTLKTFLPLYDSFKKAVDSEPENENLKQFYSQLLNLFKIFKAEPIDVNINDSFDYNLHEALTTIERDDIPENSIIDVIQDGWKVDKEILRYTKVVTSKKPKPPEPEPEPESESETEEKEEADESSKDKDLETDPEYIS